MKQALSLPILSIIFGFWSFITDIEVKSYFSKEPPAAVSEEKKEK
jgi:hypothetical protein